MRRIGDKVAKVPNITIDRRFYLLFLLITLIMFPLHESAHFLVYRLLGVHLHMTLNTASPVDQHQRRPVAEIAGPVLNLVLAVVAAVLLHISTNYRRLWAAIALSTSLMRLAIYTLIVIAAFATGSGLAIGNDEPIAAHMWHLNSLTFVALFSFPFILIVWSVSRQLEGRPRQRATHIAGLTGTMFCIGILIGNLIDPWLFSRR